MPNWALAMHPVTIANPWRLLPASQPYVLIEDAGVISKFNAHATERTRYDLSLFPEPYLGAPSAPVVLLALNPGWSPGDAVVHAEPTFAEESRLSLTHDL